MECDNATQKVIKERKIDDVDIKSDKKDTFTANLGSKREEYENLFEKERLQENISPTSFIIKRDSENLIYLSFVNHDHSYTNKISDENINHAENNNSVIKNCNFEKIDETNIINFSSFVNNIQLHSTVTETNKKAKTEEAFINYQFLYEPIDDFKRNIDSVQEIVNNAEIKRGKFVSSDPEFELQLQKPKGQAYKTVIQNGNKLRPRIVFKRKFKFLNTCAFDSYTELLRAGYFISQEFKDFLNSCSKESTGNFLNDFEKTDFNYLKIVVDYATTVLQDKFYKRRAYILHSLFDHTQPTIDCSINVNTLFLTLMTHYPSPTEVITCNQCADNKVIKKFVIPVPSLNLIWKNGYKNLENDIIEYICNKVVYCSECHQTTAIKEFKLGKYLCIDTDDVYVESNYARENNIQNFKTNLRDIPIKLCIKEQNFILCGAVEFIPPLDANGIGHYIAYNRCLNNEWEKRNDLQSRVKKFNKKCPDIKISSILYIRY